MKFSQKGKQKLGDMEGLSLEVYLDSGGAPTIGIGHLLTQSERRSGKIALGTADGHYREGLTLEQVYQLLDQDLAPVEKAVNESVKVPLTQNQYDTLVAWVFNVGISAFKGSTLLRKLNAGDYEVIPSELRKWKFDNGVVVAGLVNRREKEIQMWQA